jgi:hypothetical protein
MSSIPRGRRCPHGRECSTTGACRITTALSLSPRHYIPTRRVMLTRHQRGFPFSHPIPSLPLTCEPRTGQGSLGFPVSSAPSRYRPRTSRWGQVSNTDPKSRRRHQPTSIRRTHSSRAASCRKHCAYLPVICVRSPVPLRPVNGVTVSSVRRYSHDYYGNSVALGLASLRRSRVRLRHTS